MAPSRRGSVIDTVCCQAPWRYLATTVHRHLGPGSPPSGSGPAGRRRCVPVNSTGGCGATAWMAPPMARRSTMPTGELVGLGALEVMFKPGARLIPATATTNTAAAAIRQLGVGIHGLDPPHRPQGPALCCRSDLRSRRLEQALGCAIGRLGDEPPGDRPVGIEVVAHAIAFPAELPRASASSAARRASVA